MPDAYRVELAQISEQQGTADPIETLRRLDALRVEAEAVTLATVARARADGRSWTQIGAALGLTRQAASWRYGRRTG